MVKLTSDIIIRGTSSKTKQKREEGKEHFLRRITHLYLDNKGLEDVGNQLCACRSLSVLYLYDNKLSEVPNLISNGNLTHLYLQNNQICRIKNLGGLYRLQKLYLGGNMITVIEGLEKLRSLQELYVENQRLESGEKLILDPRSLEPLQQQGTLQILNISNNRMDCIKPVMALTSLQQLIASDNEISDFKELQTVLAPLRVLNKLDLMGNPICHKLKYRDRVIILAKNLEMLDGKEVTNLAKQFILNWQATKDSIKHRNLISRESGSQQFSDAPPLLPASHKEQSGQSTAIVGMDVPSYMMPAMPKRQFHDLGRSFSQPNSAYNSHRTKAHPQGDAAYECIGHRIPIPVTVFSAQLSDDKKVSSSRICFPARPHKFRHKLPHYEVIQPITDQIETSVNQYLDTRTNPGKRSKDTRSIPDLHIVSLRTSSKHVSDPGIPLSNSSIVSSAKAFTSRQKKARKKNMQITKSVSSPQLQLPLSLPPPKGCCPTVAPNPTPVSCMITDQTDRLSPFSNTLSSSRLVQSSLQNVQVQT